MPNILKKPDANDVTASFFCYVFFLIFDTLITLIIKINEKNA